MCPLIMARGFPQIVYVWHNLMLCHIGKTRILESRKCQDFIENICFRPVKSNELLLVVCVKTGIINIWAFLKILLVLQ